MDHRYAGEKLRLYSSLLNIGTEEKESHQQIYVLNVLFFLREHKTTGVKSSDNKNKSVRMSYGAEGDCGVLLPSFFSNGSITIYSRRIAA